MAFTGVATTMIDAIETHCIDVAAKLFGQTIVAADCVISGLVQGA